MVFRVQDAKGRGPYRPGFSHLWADDAGPINPTIFQDFGEDVASRYMKRRGYYGCAFRSLHQMSLWFTGIEIYRLILYGYRLVELTPDRVLAESPHQLLFYCKRPLTKLAKPLDWVTLAAVYDEAA